jgi:uncharacterized protein YfaS (alpha-2-macroglobulin family)
LKDQHGRVLGATGHSVTGDGVKAVPGTVEIVLDKPEYKAGDEALALITFPEPVSDASAVAGARQGRSHGAAGQGRRLAEDWKNSATPNTAHACR